ncbi:toprim domain-containing protein [Oxyplasma meridianum]|uniref:Toprim domain-containing protein n=1 Tax=Oxyplasma meridianum TaxID=3073602 RepID=A0AAX4NEL6_9ARCH
MQPDHSGMLKIIDKYREKNLDTPIVVEGKNDVQSLRKIEFSGEIIIFNSGLSIVRFSEELKERYNRIIILTDFDAKGRRLRDDIEKFFVSSGGKADTYLWEYLKRNAAVSTIEELPFAVSRSRTYISLPGKS